MEVEPESSSVIRTNPTATVGEQNPHIEGKFFFVGDRKLYLKGITYGTFRPDESGSEYGDCASVERDLACIARHGFNSIRTYTVPPMWLLDCAFRHGLRVLVGLPWEQHVAFLDDRKRANDIVARLRASIRACEKHPAILGYAIGNEIPAPVVRWFGRKRTEGFIKRLYNEAKDEDSAALITYVNYPPTEYLQLPFLDFISFNVYLESEEKLGSYLARLHNLADDRPLILAEIGLDSLRHGEEKQAHVLEWQIQSAFSSGCAGAFLFSWTDEWHRGGFDIEDWDFGLTKRNREPKQALSVVRKSFSQVPYQLNGEAPRVSVVVCACNAEATIGETLEALERVEYPNYEVIVIDDGSTDETAVRASRYRAKVVSTKNQGLAIARNLGMQLASGEIIAYVDADAYPDPQWLTHLVVTFQQNKYVAVGGPNIPPTNDGYVSDCVSNAPGGPIHVLISDSEAEHIPGCNMAFKKSVLEAIGGFDPQFRAAGDDVDVCWRIHEMGFAIGFSPGAVVWHHRRNSIAQYWNQQKGYGKAEAMLEKKWPMKYNRLGHLTWKGRLYGTGHTRSLPLGRWRIYHGVWGSGLFQSLYTRATGRFLSFPLMPEWYYVTAGLACLSAMSLLWKPLVTIIPVLIFAVAVQLGQAFYSAAHSRILSRSPVRRTQMLALITLLHLLQPLARLIGRLRHGLTPWRLRGFRSFAFPRPITLERWQEQWQSPESILHTLETCICAEGPVVIPGGEYDRWDLEIRAGTTGAVRLRSLVEEHGGGKQMVKFKCWPILSLNRFLVSASIMILAMVAFWKGAFIVAGIIGFVGSMLGGVAFLDCAAATSAVDRCFTSGDAKATE